MAGKIKGITIEFSGDTTKLDKSIKESEKQTKKLDQELRQINKDLKFNPSNVDLWRQKQEVLSQKIKETENKLTSLKQKQKDMDASGVDKNSEEYRKLQREIIETESKLKHFKAQMQEVNGFKFKILGQQITNLGKKITTVGDTLTKKLTVPIAALGTAAIAAFADVDKGLDAVVKKTGATGDELANMQDLVKDIGTELPMSFEDIGNAVGEVNTRFGVTGDELKELSEKFLKFAELNGTDVTTSIDMVQKALEAFGMDASEAGDLLDVMNRVSQKTGISVDKLQSILVKNGAELQEMGLDAYQAANFLGQVEVSGVDTTTAMTAMRKAMKVANSEGKDLSTVLEEFDGVMQSNASDTDKLKRAYELFGTKAGAAMYNAAKQGKISFKDLGDTMEDTLGSVEGTYENTLDATDQLKITFNNLKVAGAELGGALGQVLTPILQKITAAIKKFAEWWSNLSPKTQQLITKIGLLAAAIGPLLSIGGRIVQGIGNLIGKIPTLVSGVSKVIGGVKTLITAMASNPYVAMAVGAAAAVTAIIALVRAQNKITREYEKAKKAREEAIEDAYTQAETADLYMDKLEELSKKENKSTADKKKMKVYVDKLNSSVEGLNLSYDEEADKLNLSTKEIRNKIQAYKDQVIQQAYANQMQEVANDLVQTEIDLDDVRTKKAEVNAQLRSATSEEEINRLGAELKELDTKETQLVKKQEGLYDELDRYADKASGSIEKTGDKMEEASSKAKSSGSKAGEKFDSAAASSIKSNADKTKTAVDNLMNKLKNSNSAEAGGKTIGAQIDYGIVKGLDQNRYVAINMARQVVDDALSAMKKRLGIASPSKVMRDEVGKNMSLGIGEGLLSGLKAVKLDAQKLISGTVGAMQPPNGLGWYKQGEIFGSAIAGSGAGSSVNLSGIEKRLDNLNARGTAINITVNASQGMDINALTAAIEQKMIQLTKRRSIAWGN